MSDETSGSASPRAMLPDTPNLDWLRKQAKHRLAALRESDPDAKLADAQFALAKEYGFSSWRALKAHVDSLTIDGQLFDAAERGDVASLGTLLDADPTKLAARKPPYSWSLLHAAAHKGQLAVVDLLLSRGLDVNTREEGDNTSAMHWAAAAGHVDVVRRLIDAGGDVVGHGDDHELEVIGWASCWDGATDDAHRRVVELLLRHGARHHIFSAIAMDLPDEVRRLVTDDATVLTRRMSRNENNMLPLHFAVRMGRGRMVSLLMELGADPLGVDGDGFPVAIYAETPELDRAVMERIRALTLAELDSAQRGKRPARATLLDLLAALTLRELETAARLVRENPQLLKSGALHVMSKRGDVAAVKWLLDHGAPPNALWSHWDSELTALHLAVLSDHADVATVLIAAGADPRIRDSKHDSDAIGWAEFFGRTEMVRVLAIHS